MRRAVLVVLTILFWSVPGWASAAAPWAWPVTGPVLRAFDPPSSPYGAGHRGIDIGSWPGTPILAPESGNVSFAGPVGGYLFVTIDHGGGLSSTYSWVSQIHVRKGDVVSRGQTIGLTGTGHPGSGVPALHLGVKLNDVYVDPLDYLEPLNVSGLIRLASLVPGPI